MSFRVFSLLSNFLISFLLDREFFYLRRFSRFCDVRGLSCYRSSRCIENVGRMISAYICCWSLAERESWWSNCRVEFKCGAGISPCRSDILLRLCSLSGGWFWILIFMWGWVTSSISCSCSDLSLSTFWSLLWDERIDRSREWTWMVWRRSGWQTLRENVHLGSNRASTGWRCLILWSSTLRKRTEVWMVEEGLLTLIESVTISCLWSKCVHRPLWCCSTHVWCICHKWTHILSLTRIRRWNIRNIEARTT